MYTLSKDTEITPELLLALVDHFSLHSKPRLDRLGRYYETQHDIGKRKFDDPTKPNHRIVNPYPKYITDIATGYFLGAPVKYGTDDDLLMEKLQDLLDNNDDGTHNLSLGKHMSIFGTAFEFVYVNPVAEIKFTTLDPRSTFVVYDDTVEAAPLFAVRFYSTLDYMENTEQMHVELFTDKAIFHFEKVEDELIERELSSHFFGGVPVIEYKNNEERLGDFEPVLSLVDAYDLAVSDTANDLSYFTDAYLKLSGMEETEPEDVARMKQDRVLLIPEGGDASFLVKQSDYNAVEVYKKRLREDIHKFSMTPDLTDSNFASNASGVAMKYKVFGLENVTVNKEGSFKESLSNRMRLLVTMLNVKGGNHDPDGVYFTFHRNLPQDNEALIKMAKELLGLVSHETAISSLPSNIVDDVAFEMKRIEEERTSSYMNFFDEPQTQEENE